MTETPVWQWLSHHKQFQEGTYGTIFADFESDYAARTEFVSWNLRAAIHELVEAGDETPWKPWSSRDPEEMWKANRDNYAGEIIDVLFFLANAALAVGMTDEEIEQRYKAKAAVNTQRQESGYDAHSTKCPHCTRELDKPGAYEIQDVELHTGLEDNVSIDLYTLVCRSCRETFEYTLATGERLPGA